MLKLRRGRVSGTDPLTVELEGDAAGTARPAWADPSLVGECLAGDEVVVNTEALDLGLGSGGFDLVCVNLTRGLEHPGSDRDHVMKLNYSPLQHPIGTVEREVGDSGVLPDRPTPSIPVLAIGLHGHLAPAAWAAARTADGCRTGYIQTGGGALPGTLSRDVKALLDHDLLAGHVTAGAAYGAPAEAITLVGALDAAADLGWDAVIAGPGPGILGSGTAYGHGGMAALDVLHGALSLGMPALLSPRLSAADPRARHTGLSHHSRAVLSLCLGPVEVPLPETAEDLLGEKAPAGGLDQAVTATGHRPVRLAVDLGLYGQSGMPRRSMGRDLQEDPVFFAAPLAAGRRLGELVSRTLPG